MEFLAWLRRWIDHIGILLTIRDPDLHRIFCLRCSLAPASP